MTIEVTTLAPRAEHLLDERIKDETLTSLMEPTWLITPEGQGMISGPENVMEENLADYIADREDEAHQLTDLYMFMLEGANKMGESLPGYLNRHHKNELAQENYSLFMKKYNQDMQNFENFGEKDAAEFMDDGLLDAMKQQKNIRTQYPLNPEYQRLANGGPLIQVGPDERETLDSQVAIIEMQKEAIRDAIREKGAPLTDEELNNIRQSYSLNYGNTDLDYTKDQMRVYDKNSGINYVYESLPGLANGGSPEQEFVNQRIAELMMEEPVNEMRAVTPDMFERQKLGIERLLSNLYEPRRARDIAETVSTAVDFSPAGIPTAVAEGIRMMGDDQPLMGAGMVALGVSPFKGLSKVQLQKAYQKLQKELTETIEDIKYRAQSYRKSFNETGNKGDGFDADRLDAMARRMEKRNLREQDEVKELLKQGEIGFDDDDYVLAIDEIMAREGIDDPAEAALRLKALQKGSKDETLYDHMSRQRRLGVPDSKELKDTRDTLQEIAKEKARDGELLEQVQLAIKKGLIPPLTQTGRKLSGSKSILPEKEALERSDRFLNIKSDGRSYGFHKKGESTSWFIDPETNEVFKWYSGEGATPKGYHVRREVPDFVRKLQESSRRNQPKQVKGIINATPETQKLYQELLNSPSAVNTPRHNKVKKDASEQLREIKKQVEESDLEDRNEVLRLLAQLRDKKPK